MAKLQIPDKKPSRVLEILRKEYPFERILLGVLGALVIILGVYLLQGILNPTQALLEIRLTDWWIFNSETKRIIFTIVVIVIGVVSLFMAIWPFFVPSFAEMKKVTWPNRKTILNHSARVFGFIIILSAFFLIVDWPLRRLFQWITELGA
ncbi:preprotein translocase subunit SecE [Candidatus Xianfuyuplasma coldseepsis]|uniref:Preprotein translocase subunit SecE n=1 Tax=Candidatus Xianfuyuplasma coldseepsis TaxID=2782163 RepID=A0A7L7KSV1_9MOLU|nr:preprotein translocase subunit SecE [Xianfuyuplasma coldseepsis]QMS85352.1 preprotein translocase subunit SecE [Xianfuyuplasma coldseepsis]